MMTTTELLARVIPFGRENAISRQGVAAALGCGDRQARKAIEDARADGLFIINLQDGHGYYQSTDKLEMLRQYRQDTARAMSILKRRKALRKTLIDMGVPRNDL